MVSHRGLTCFVISLATALFWAGALALFHRFVSILPPIILIGVPIVAFMFAWFVMAMSESSADGGAQ